MSVLNVCHVIESESVTSNAQWRDNTLTIIYTHWKLYVSWQLWENISLKMSNGLSFI
jgi:hypothetical protein